MHPLADLSPADLKGLRFQVLNLKKQNKQTNKKESDHSAFSVQ